MKLAGLKIWIALRKYLIGNYKLQYLVFLCRSIKQKKLLCDLVFGEIYNFYKNMFITLIFGERFHTKVVGTCLIRFSTLAVPRHCASL